jgi:hypothetical protein
MEYPHLETPLRELVRRYRDMPFSTWEDAYATNYELDDYSPENEPFWQAHTVVLELETAEDGRRFANVAITIYPEGVHSMPPAPYAGLHCFDDGTCRIFTPWGEEYEYEQLRS